VVAITGASAGMARATFATVPLVIGEAVEALRTIGKKL
jgi:hypothetical protein